MHSITDLKGSNIISPPKKKHTERERKKQKKVMATASVMMSSMSLKPAPRGLPSLGTTFRVVASGVKKIKTDTPYG